MIFDRAIFEYFKFFPNVIRVSTKRNILGKLKKVYIFSLKVFLATATLFLYLIKSSKLLENCHFFHAARLSRLTLLQSSSHQEQDF